MKISVKSNDSSFTPHPEADCTAVCVDVTPLKTVDSSFGQREVFKLVFESSILRDDDRPFLVWSRNFTPSLHEKSAFRAFLRQWFGRDLTAAELNEFDTESLIGRTARLSIVHSEYNGSTYANIALARADKSETPLKASGHYTRIKDREQDQDGRFRPASGGSSAPDWRRTKVHVGKHKGLDLGDLDRGAVEALVTKWLPNALEKEKPLKADRDLIAALQHASQALLADDEDNDTEPF